MSKVAPEPLDTRSSLCRLPSVGHHGPKRLAPFRESSPVNSPLALPPLSGRDSDNSTSPTANSPVVLDSGSHSPSNGPPQAPAAPRQQTNQPSDSEPPPTATEAELAEFIRERIPVSLVSALERITHLRAVSNASAQHASIKKVCVVMNPISGGGKAQHLILETSEKSLTGTGSHRYRTMCFLDAMKETCPDLEIQVVKTQRSKHAVELAEQYAREGWTVVGCGGDGTLCETIQGVMQAGTGEPCGFVSGGSMNFFAISAGIESPVKVVECIKANTVNSLSIRRIQDAAGSLPDPTYSIESINFGLPVRAMQMQDWGRGNCCGPVSGVKIGAFMGACCKNSTENHVEARLTITQEDGTEVTREDSFSWIMITARHPGHGGQDAEGRAWINLITTEQLPNLPRIVESIKDPQEMTGGTARFFEESIEFVKVELEPLNAIGDEQRWNFGLDGDLTPCFGVLTIENVANAVKLVSPHPFVPNPQYTRTALSGPTCLSAQQNHEQYGGKRMEVDKGSCCIAM